MITPLILLLNVLVVCLVLSLFLFIIRQFVPIPLQILKIIYAIFACVMLIWLLEVLSNHTYQSAHGFWLLT